MTEITLLDRRRQPQTTLKTVRAALREISWPIEGITSHRFISPSGSFVDESFGYKLKVPPDLEEVRKFWVGFVSHRKARPGIYACLTPRLESAVDVIRQGYYESPFSAYLLIKKLIPKARIDALERNYGQIQIKKIIKEILLKTYPFNVKK